MKKSIILVGLSVIFLSAPAQREIGIKAGVNFPNLTGEDVNDDIGNKTGFYVGGVAIVSIAGHFNFQPELLWSNKGYKYNELGSEFTTTFNYIHIPLLIQYLSNGFFVETGPQAGFLFSAKSKGGTLGTVDIKDSFKPVAFSWCAGLGYRLTSGFAFAARYTIGLNSISDESSINAKFNVLMIGLAKTFAIAGKKK